MRYRGTTSWKFLMITAALGAVGIALRGTLDEHGGMWVWATVPVLVAVLSLFAIGAGLERSLRHGLGLAMCLPVVGALWAVLMLRAPHVGPGITVVMGIFALVCLVLAFKKFEPKADAPATGGHGHAAHH